MDTMKRQFLRVARDIHGQLRALAGNQYVRIEQQLALLVEGLGRLDAFRRKLRTCQVRNWHGAAKRLIRTGESIVRDVPYHVRQVEEALVAQKQRLPTVGDIYADLLQAGREFPEFTWRPREQKLVVQTEAIELECTYLGPFEIQLYVPDLAEMRTCAPYRIVALDPQPAANNPHVTHPHVSDEQLCPGDAGAAIQAALATGRICDFFTLVTSVLGTYNRDSPYVALDDWFGVACYDCGCMTDRDETYWCRCCEHDFCTDCVSSCDQCSDTTCLGCLKECMSCGNSTCLNCIDTCPVCEEPVCHNCLTTCPDCETKLCRLCLTEEQCPCMQDDEESDHDQAPGDTNPGPGAAVLTHGVGQTPVLP